MEALYFCVVKFPQYARLALSLIGFLSRPHYLSINLLSFRVHFYWVIVQCVRPHINENGRLLNVEFTLSLFSARKWGGCRWSLKEIQACIFVRKMIERWGWWCTNELLYRFSAQCESVLTHLAAIFFLLQGSSPSFSWWKARRQSKQKRIEFEEETSLAKSTSYK